MWNAIWSITEANDDISSPELPKQRKVSPHLAASHDHPDAFVHTETKDHCCQIYYEVLDAVTVGLSDRLEPDAIATHLGHVEKFLTCQQEHVNYIVGRLTLHRDLLMESWIEQSQLQGRSHQKGGKGACPPPN